MTEVNDPISDNNQIATKMQHNHEDDTASISGESDCSIDENFTFNQYLRTFDAESESISLLNLSISPISANHDDEYVKDFYSYSAVADDTDDNVDEERVSLDEITAQINTPPASQTKNATKRLSLETIFEGVFLETPPKRRKFEPWRIRTIREVTTEERISTYVREQQASVEHNGATTDALCNLFDERIDIQ